MNEKEFKKVKYEIEPIGWVDKDEDGKLIRVLPEFRPAMLELEDYSHLQIIWWAHLSDSSNQRKKLSTGKLFKKGPDKLGVFSTRSPVRPNPLMSSTIAVTKIDLKNGIILMPFMDAEAGSPVLDINPYKLMERVKD